MKMLKKTGLGHFEGTTKIYLAEWETDNCGLTDHRKYSQISISSPYQISNIKQGINNHELIQTNLPPPFPNFHIFKSSNHHISKFSHPHILNNIEQGTRGF